MFFFLPFQIYAYIVLASFLDFCVKIKKNKTLDTNVCDIIKNVLLILYFFCFFFQAYRLPEPLYCPNRCGRCYKGVYRKFNLNKHLAHECGVPRKFLCPMCPKRFKRKQALQKHYIFIHKLLFE